MGNNLSAGVLEGANGDNVDIVTTAQQRTIAENQRQLKSWVKNTGELILTAISANAAELSAADYESDEKTVQNDGMDVDNNDAVKDKENIQNGEDQKKIPGSPGSGLTVDLSDSDETDTYFEDENENENEDEDEDLAQLAESLCAKQTVRNEAMDVDNIDAHVEKNQNGEDQMAVTENIENGDDQKKTAESPVASCSGMSVNHNDSGASGKSNENYEEVPTGGAQEKDNDSGAAGKCHENYEELPTKGAQEKDNDSGAAGKSNENYEELPTGGAQEKDNIRSEDQIEKDKEDALLNSETSDVDDETDGPSTKRAKMDVSSSRSDQSSDGDISESLGSEDSDTEDEEDLGPSGSAGPRISMFKKTNSKLVSELSGSSSNPLDDTDRVKKRRRKRKINKRIEYEDEDQLVLSTVSAMEEEKRKKERILQRRNQFGISDIDDMSRATLTELVLDYDSNTRAPTVAVDPGLLKKLKPHQANGIRFMWESCFESLEQIRSEDHKSTGCILAHCMGLGKTLQVVTLIHTLFCHGATAVKRVLVVCPLSTASNWIAELNNWLEYAQQRPTFKMLQIMSKYSMAERVRVVTEWMEEGGVLVVGDVMFAKLVTLPAPEDAPENYNHVMTEALHNPGPDLMVIDEGHLLKNDGTKKSEALSKVRTRRRILLTGTPLQNNLKEYYCMVNYVKPNLLGNPNEYRNRFMGPITNGQFADSDELEIQKMKRCSHVLHKLLDSTLQRKDYSVLSPYLPRKFEFVLQITMTSLQMSLYKLYIEKNVAKRRLFRDFQTFLRIYNHPLALKFHQEKKTKEMNSQSEAWWDNPVTQSQLEYIQSSNKMVVLFDILHRCEKKGEKLLVFSQSLYALDTIEFFLEKSQNSSWVKDTDYFRIDGDTNEKDRDSTIDKFNKVPTARLLLITKKAGGIGINLVGANRVVLFDVSWNPSDDVQSIFRVFRFGQTKKCFIYRFIAKGTMEEKKYDRQVTKLSVAKRVVDEKQIYRHFSEQELADLYQLQPLPPPRQRIEMPTDDSLLKSVINKNKSIHSYQIHDSLLRDLEKEKLSREEQLHAWQQFEEEAARAGDAKPALCRINELINVTVPPADVRPGDAPSQA